MEDPSLEVVLIEPNRKFISCPFSNLVLSGVRSNRQPHLRLQRAARAARREDPHESATASSPTRGACALDRGFLSYERLIVAPGIDFQTEPDRGPWPAAVGHLLKLAAATVCAPPSTRGADRGGGQALDLLGLEVECRARR